MRRSITGPALALAAAATLGCSDALPTASNAEGDLQIPEETALMLEGALSDAHERILPALDEHVARLLEIRLRQVTQSMHARSSRRLVEAIEQTRAALDQLAHDDAQAGIASDLDAIRLILDEARPLAEPPTERSRALKVR